MDGFGGEFRLTRPVSDSVSDNQHYVSTGELLPGIWPNRAGELRRWHKRTVNRRVRYMKQTRGFLLVNDGVTTAAGIARVVEFYHEQRGGGWFGAHPSMTQRPPVWYPQSDEGSEAEPRLW